MRHVTVMTLTSALGLGFMFLVDFLALFWVSRLKVEAFIAAIGYAGTLQFFLVSISIGMTIGAVALVSRTLGADRPQRARRIASMALIVSVGRRSMAVTSAAGAVAVVLDPVVILWMGWGVEGAATVIVISRAVMALVGLFWLIGVKRMLARPQLVDFQLYLGRFLAISLPAIATQLSTPFGNWVLIRAMAEHGDSAVAGMGVVMRVTILGFGGIFALSGAIGGIIGQNAGAGLRDRVQSAYLDALKFCLVYTLVVWALLASASGIISEGFGLSPEGAHIVKVFSLYAVGSFFFTGALFVSNAAFNNLGRPLWATVANWIRDGVLIGVFAFAMGAVWGETGVVMAQAAANVLVGTAAALVGWRLVRDGHGVARRA